MGGLIGEVAQSELKCVLCGMKYRSCRCTCKVCGAKKWTFDGKHWKHHFCNPYRASVTARAQA